jgi:negative regulator of flagellin synthesis FlgM
MQISGHGRADQLATLLLGTQENGPVKSNRSKASDGSKDRVQISQQAKEMQRIRALADQPDDARAARVEQISRSVEAGTYNVDGRKVGDAVIRHALTDASL